MVSIGPHRFNTYQQPIYTDTRVTIYSYAIWVWWHKVFAMRNFEHFRCEKCAIPLVKADDGEREWSKRDQEWERERETGGEGKKQTSVKMLVVAFAYGDYYYYEWKGAEVRWSLQFFFFFFCDLHLLLRINIAKEPVSQLTFTVALITFTMEKWRKKKKIRATHQMRCATQTGTLIAMPFLRNHVYMRWRWRGGRVLH